MLQTVYVQLCDFQHFCRRLKTLTDEESGKLHIRRDKATNVPEVGCFIEVMDAFFRVVPSVYTGMDKTSLNTSAGSLFVRDSVRVSTSRRT